MLNSGEGGGKSFLGREEMSTTGTIVNHPG